MEEVDVYLIVARQKTLAKELEKIQINFGKDSGSRKTKRYVEERLRKIEEIWKEFQSNHDNIRGVVKHDTPYMERDTFEAVKSIYEKIKNDLEKVSPADNKDNEEEQTSSAGNDQQTQTLKKLDIKIAAIMRSIDAFEQTFENYSKEVHEYQQKILLEQWRNLTELHEEFLSKATKQDYKVPYMQENRYEGVEDDINNCLFQMASRSSEINNKKISSSTQEVRLPQLKIPIFKGNYLNWQSFCDIFTTLIHDKATLSITEKMEYLKTHLEGEPLQIIQHFTISSENYNNAWETLKMRYDNERKIVSIHLDRMFKINHAGNQPSASHLKQILDANKEGLAALKLMGHDTSSWSPIIVHLIIKMLDPESRNLFEQTIKNPNKMPTQEELFDFLTRRYRALEVLSSPRQKPVRDEPRNYIRNYHLATAKCVFCKSDHNIYSCNKFMSWTPKERYEQVKAAKLCVNCLRHDKQSACLSKRLCKQCNKRHNSLLHIEQFEKRNINQARPDQTRGQYVDRIQPQVNYANHGQSILLATAIIIAKNRNGESIQIRALIDPGSQATLITEQVAQSLRLIREKVFIPIGGLGATDAGTARSRVNFLILPRTASDFQTEVQALVLPKLTRLLPAEKTSNLKAGEFKDLTLADPGYNAPGAVDMILGADIYGEIILDGVRKGKKGFPIAQKSHLGWLITGRTSAQKGYGAKITGLVVQTSIEKQLEKFWEMEEFQDRNHLTVEEEECEKVYQETHYRDENGRYVVNIPFNKSLSQSHKLGDSRNRAVARLRQLEHKFSTDKILKDEYTKFMKEFLDLGHMVETVPANNNRHNIYYMPHHAVHKPDSTTTKLRVVFDASAKTTSGVSLNQIMLVGPKLQEDLTTILLRWRRHKYVFTADIEKMYRQIKVNKQHQDYQRIVWRNSEKEPIKEYKLTTVTYGTASAPYLAVRTLQQLAADEQFKYPVGSDILKNDFYVDDVLSGRSTLTDCIQAQTQLTQLLKKAGFNLRKWATNNINLRGTNSDIQGKQFIEIDKEDTIKALGIHWNPSTDTLQFKVKDKATNQQVYTKRTTLSEIATLYDPLGWLAPVTVKAKLLMQELWKSNLTWDEPLTSDLQHCWCSLKNNLNSVEDIKIPRWMGTTEQHKIELHGFCDASESAYAAVVYSRLYLQDGSYKVTLLVAKTKVAPIKRKITLPKLELCGAHLLARLLWETQQVFQSQVGDVYAWTDSTITLAWIKRCPSTLKTFVANRVSQIQEKIAPNLWRHVRSSDNPADCASRGIVPDQLKNHPLWWNGPEMLKQSSSHWPTEEPAEKIIPESKIILTTVLETENLFARFSSYNRLIRVIAYCKRFISNCKKTEKLQGILTADELEGTRKAVIRTVQQREFPAEWACLQGGRPLDKKSKLLSLNPLLNEDNLIIVGGRLQNSALAESQKHPLILPHHDIFTKLLVEHTHKKTLHGGIQLTLATLRQSYWIVQAKRVVRQIIHQCVRCHRFNAAAKRQIMGILPTPRVTPSRPFTHCGIDYAGPIKLLVSKGRGNRSIKGYISVFVCLATKAIHIELVSDLTSEAFLAAIRRFISRRGTCSDIYSDNGTTFVGANKEIQELVKLADSQWRNEISEKLAIEGIRWHFIPPAAPHFGGLWEAGVKSVKHHLKRIIGDTTLTFEEMSTLLTQIEACLNSRPLTVISNDVEDGFTLTPGHFLIGSAINALPEPIMDSTRSYRSRWMLVQKMSHDFWKAWSTDYLLQLQQRSKWKKKTANINIGDVVIIKDDRLPPTKWQLGKVTEVHPGKDEQVRAATVLTNGNTYKRPISKLCPLPISQSEETYLDTTNSINETVQTHTAVINNSIIDRKTRDRTNHVSQGRKNSSSSKNLPKCNSILWTLLITAFVTTTTCFKNMDGVQVNQFETQPGIYFEDVGRANMIASSWKTIVFFNLSNYWSEFYTYKECVIRMKEICTKNASESITALCDNSLPQFNQQLQQIELNNDVLLHANAPIRNKRSPFDIVGTVANELFGVLDQRFAQRYEETIGNVQDNENHILQLMKNQTSIIDSTINVFKKDKESNQRQLTLLTESIKNLSESYSAFRMFTSNAMSAMLMMINYQNTQNILLDIVLSTHNGRMHPLILSVKQLKNELVRIHDNIPRTLMTPGERHHESILQLYKDLVLRGRVTNNNILIEITIPLLFKEDFKVYNVLPVPTWHKESFTYIVPSSQYLLVSLQGERYYPMSEQAMGSCKQRSAGMYWCNLIHPIYTSVSTVSACEMNILQHSNLLPTSCTTATIPARGYWVKMHHPNTWIFSMPSKRSVDIICDQETKEISLQGSGTLILQENCMIRQQGMIIVGTQTMSSRLELSFLPTNNISQQLMNFSHVKEDVPFLQPDVLKDVGQIEKALETQRDQEKVLLELRTHKIQHYTTVGSITALLFIIIVFLIILRIRGQTITIQQAKINKSEPTRELDDLDFCVTST